MVGFFDFVNRGWGVFDKFENGKLEKADLYNCSSAVQSGKGFSIIKFDKVKN